MPDFDRFEALSESLKAYIQTNIELVKLQAIERASVIGSGIASSVILGVVGLLFIVFLSVWAGLYVGLLLGAYHLGFACVAGFYLIVAILLILSKKKIIGDPIRNIISRVALSKSE